jgi:hypothetical protein
MIEVFKTNVKTVQDCKRLLKQLSNVLPDGRISFDLEDCDKILRVEDTHISPAVIINLLKENGHHCEILDC